MKDILLIGLLIGIPYAWMLTKVCSWAYFREKLNYQHALINRLTTHEEGSNA
jgi:hypothetical protein